MPLKLKINAVLMFYQVQIQTFGKKVNKSTFLLSQNQIFDLGMSLRIATFVTIIINLLYPYTIQHQLINQSMILSITVPVLGARLKVFTSLFSGLAGIPV